MQFSWHKLSAVLHCRQLPQGQTPFSWRTLSSWQVKLIIKAQRYCYLKLVHFLHRQGRSTASSWQVRWGKAMLCSTENNPSAKELYIDLTSHNRLLFIKLSSSPASIESVCRWDRIFSEAHLPGSHDRLGALSQSIKTGWGRATTVNCAMIHLPVFHLWCCHVSSVRLSLHLLQCETKLSELVLHCHSSKTLSTHAHTHTHAH